MSSSRPTISDNIKFYNSIKPKSDTNSYTVLATLNDYTTGELLALANGTQASIATLPNDIEDCHAESLLKRAYKRYLVDKLKHDLIRNYNPARLGNLINRQLTLFISQFPCGLIKRYEGLEPVDESTGLPIKKKPGRGLAVQGRQVIYLNKNDCFTKLQAWVENGFQGKRLAYLLGEGLVNKSTIRKIVIGDCEPEAEFDYESGLRKLRQELPSDLEYEHLSSIRQDEFVFASDKQPQPVALVWWKSATAVASSRQDGTTEFIVDGRRRGLTKSQSLLGHRQVQVSGASLGRDLDSLQQLLATSQVASAIV